jgi:dipeptidyl aminopeptidase/acylaminoacyl peptidase
MASPSAEASAVGGRLAFLRDGELVTLDLETGTETETGVTDLVPIAFTLDHDALIGTRAVPADPYVVTLVRQPVDGSPPTVLVEALPNYGAPSPSPEGRYVAFGSDGASPNGLVLVDLESGEATQLTTDGAIGAVWSPDGSTLAYSRMADTEGNDLFAIDMASGSSRRLTADEWEDDPLRWTDDGSSVLTTSHRGGDGTRLAITVWEIDAASGDLTPRPELAADVIRYELRSPDRRWTARISPQSILSITEPDLRVGNRLGRVDLGVHLTWAPNSAWLVWSAFDEDAGATDLLMVHAPDGEPIQLTRTPEGESHPVWGPVRHGF